MDKHREKCKRLKEIRKRMADCLGIDLHQRECTYQGDCKGTCPKCRQEEETLNKALLGRATAVAVSAGVMLTGCGAVDETGTVEAPPEISHHGEELNWEKVKDAVTEFKERLKPSGGRGWGDLAGDVEIVPGETYELDGDIEVLPEDDIAGMEEDIQNYGIEGLVEALPEDLEE